MTLPRSAADVLAGHVLFEIGAIDRMYLNLCQPRLQHGAGIAAFFVGHRGHRFASSALMAPVTAAFTADISHFIAARGLELVRFGKGQRKDDLTREYLRRADLDDRGLVPGQVLYAGVAQEKQKVFRTCRRRNPVTHGRFKSVKAVWVAARYGMSRSDLAWRVAVEMGRSSGMTWVFLQIRVIPGASPWSSLPLLLPVAGRLRLRHRPQPLGSVMTC